MGVPFGQGIQFLFDAQQQYARAGLSVYLRVRNFLDQGDNLEVGVAFVPSGTDAFNAGYTDILITPPPSVQDVSLHNIGLLAGKLNFGSRIFLVSDTFVVDQMREFDITDPYQVWRQRDGKFAVGLFYNSRMFSIESITHKEVAAKTVVWKLVGNALENQSDAPQV